MTDLDVLRATTWRTVVALHHDHGLPMPCDYRSTEITTNRQPLRTLSLSFDEPGSVDAWSKHIGLWAPEWFDGENYRIYKAQRFAWPQQTWLTWHSVYLTAMVPKPELVAAAVLTPDALSLPGGVA